MKDSLRRVGQLFGMSVRVPGTKTTEQKLTNRLLLRTVAVIAGVAVILMFIAGWIMDNRLYAQRRESMYRELNMVRATIEGIMLDHASDKHYRVHAALDRLLQDSTYLNFWMIGTDTTVLYSRNFSDHVMKLDLLSAPGCATCHADRERMKTRDQEYYFSKDTRAFHLTIPIKNRKECTQCHDPGQETRAILVADFSLAQLDTQIRSSRFQLNAFLGISFVLSVVSAYLFLKTSAYRPLELIATRLRRIAAGEFEVRGGPSPRNILGFINELLDNTASRLGGFYSELEAKVHERTQSLRTSEQLLADERDKLAFILQHSPQGIIGISTDQTILFANQKAEEYLSVSSVDLLKQSANRYPLLKRILSEFEVANDSSSARPASMDTPTYWKDGSGREFEVQAVLTGAVVQNNLLLVSLTDVTQRRQIERNMERHERLASIGQLAAGVAHEVGNPLSAIHSLIQIARQAETPDKAADHFDLISYHVERINRIVKHLTGFARQPAEEKTRCNINSVVRSAVEIARFDPTAKDVTLDINLPAQAIEITSRGDQLMQAVLNVILNSFDAVRERSQPFVTVSVTANDANCTIMVKDNGIGIEKAHRDKIFEPFFTTKPVGKGTGLGLSVTYRIITDLGGSISVESDVNAGTEFSIILPLK